ncbi:MAG: nucleoid-associated protein [Ferruginibacter sp.]
MITYSEAALKEISIHYAGSKLLDEKYRLSDSALKIKDETLGKILMQYFLLPFEKLNERYHFMHPSDDLQLNEVFHFAEKIFNDPADFHEQSTQIVKHLYDVSNHPKIKSGELYVAYFTDLQLDGELLDAIGIFKSETKETYLKVFPEGHHFEMQYEEEAINIKKLDKGCLIFNTANGSGYKVAVLDQTNRNGEAVYWIDDFLKLAIINNDFNQTNTTLSIYKNFVTEKMDELFDVSKADKIDMLNRSMNYFKQNDSFEIEEFASEVIGDPKGIESFKLYKSNYENEYEMEIGDSFSISDAAVKKQARFFRSVLKLDKNFHIYIHGNNEMIEKGFDSKKNMNFYKVYFKEEK